MLTIMVKCDLTADKNGLQMELLKTFETSGIFDWLDNWTVSACVKKGVKKRKQGKDFEAGWLGGPSKPPSVD